MSLREDGTTILISKETLEKLKKIKEQEGLKDYETVIKKHFGWMGGKL